MSLLDERTDAGPARRPQSQEDLEISVGALRAKVRQLLTATAEISRFGISAFKTFPDLRHYGSEVLRQSAALILSSALVIWLMMFVIGLQCGVEANYTLKQLGAPLYSGIFAAFCGLRELSPYMWGYILAAKVGCGLVAEIGSMRISDEIDAMEVMGVDSKTYLVGTRVAAAMIAMPFLFIVGLGFNYLSMYLVLVQQFGEVSSGGYDYIFWLYQNPLDLLYVLSKIMATGVVIVIVGCYYGFNARGGPVGVGKATATSMMVNMVLIHVVGVLATQLFWGLSPNAPIAN